MFEIVEIGGLKIVNVTFREGLQIVKDAINNRKKYFIMTAAAWQIVLFDKNPEFRRIANSADVIFCDGISLVFMSKIIGTPIKERVTGIDFLENFWKFAREEDYRIFLLGGAIGIAKKALEKLTEKYGAVKAMSLHDIAYGKDFSYKNNKEIISQINNFEPDVLFVGMGVPRQERWVYLNKDELNVSVSFCVGGSFDTLSGNKKRAPHIIRKTYTEGIYRLIQDPKRYWRKTLLEVPFFPIYILKNIKRS